MLDTKIYCILRSYESGLKEFINVSKVTLVDAAKGDPLDKATDSSKFLVYRTRVDVTPASGHKCARCWNYMPEVSNYGVWQNVCTRCQSALKEMNVAPPQAENAGAVA